MAKPVDMSKFLKTIDKSATISRGFHDPEMWVDTGHYLLNYFISGNFKLGIPLGKVSILAGDSGAGKSFIASGSIVKNCQDMGITPVIIDSENALDEGWLQDLGVDTSPEKLMKFNMAKVNDVAKVISEFMAWYKKEYDGLPKEEQPAFMFIIDSLGMLNTDNDEKQFNDGNMKGDMGLKAKQLKALIQNTVHMIAPYNIGMLCTNHTYASQDMFDPDDKISGGSGPIYAASIVVAMKKRKDKDGSEVRGIKAQSRVMKSRYGRAFITADVIINFSNGLERYSGLIDYLIKLGVVVQAGAWCSYIDANGVEHKETKGKFESNEELLQKIIDEFDYEKHSLRSKTIAQEEIEERLEQQESDEE